MGDILFDANTDAVIQKMATNENRRLFASVLDANKFTATDIRALSGIIDTLKMDAFSFDAALGGSFIDGLEFESNSMGNPANEKYKTVRTTLLDTEPKEIYTVPEGKVVRISLGHISALNLDAVTGKWLTFFKDKNDGSGLHQITNSFSLGASDFIRATNFGFSFGVFPGETLLVKTDVAANIEVTFSFFECDLPESLYYKDTKITGQGSYVIAENTSETDVLVTFPQYNAALVHRSDYFESRTGIIIQLGIINPRGNSNYTNAHMTGYLLGPDVTQKIPYNALLNVTLMQANGSSSTRIFKMIPPGYRFELEWLSASPPPNPIYISQAGYYFPGVNANVIRNWSDA